MPSSAYAPGDVSGRGKVLEARNTFVCLRKLSRNPTRSAAPVSHCAVRASGLRCVQVRTSFRGRDFAVHASADDTALLVEVGQLESRNLWRATFSASREPLVSLCLGV